MTDYCFDLFILGVLRFNFEVPSINRLDDGLSATTANSNSVFSKRNLKSALIFFTKVSVAAA